MMMNFQKYPPHPVYHPHPPLLGTSHDPRIAPPPPRPYGAPPVVRAYLDPYHRSDVEMSRPSAAYHYPPTVSTPATSSPYAPEPVYAPFRTESSGYPVPPTDRSAKRPSVEGEPKQPNLRQSHVYSHNPNPPNRPERRLAYREGRVLSFYSGFRFSVSRDVPSPLLYTAYLVNTLLFIASR